MGLRGDGRRERKVGNLGVLLAARGERCRARDLHVGDGFVRGGPILGNIFARSGC